jgi:hypothetical protein
MSAERDSSHEQRQAIIRRHARMRGPKVSFCGESRLEREGRNYSFRTQPNGKVIYDDREVAESAARELLALTGVAFRPYECPRSRHGHHHLTQDRSPGTVRRLKEAHK